MLLHFTKLRIAFVGVAVFCGVLLAVPNILPPSVRASLPVWLPHKALQEGFDLKGGAQLILELDESAVEGRSRGALVKESVAVINKRVELFFHNVNADGWTVSRLTKNRILVQVAGMDDVGRLKDYLGQTANLQFRFVRQDSDTILQNPDADLPAGVSVLYSPDDPPQSYLVEGENLLDAHHIQSASAEEDREDGGVVRLILTTNGAEKLQELTNQNIGKRLAIILDGDVVSAPVIEQPITTGTALLSGRFTYAQAQDLAAVLSSGVLPARFNVVDERTVLPGLGKDASAAGLWAALVSTLAMFAFMILMYGLFGVFSTISVIVLMAMMIGLMSALSVPLTLPALAAFILTIAMSVDANIIVYERIRDEILRGKTAVNAVDKGFFRALATILDSNIVLLLICIVLAVLAGAGPVRGFALTMVLGIFTTVFTAYSVNRLIIAVWLKLHRPRVLPL